MGKLEHPGDSIRDLFIPKRWRSQKTPLKESRELTIPKRSRLESPGRDYIYIYLTKIGKFLKHVFGLVDFFVASLCCTLSLSHLLAVQSTNTLRSRASLDLAGWSARQPGFLWRVDLKHWFCPHTLGRYPIPPKPHKERNSFINCWWNIRGIFQGYVGGILNWSILGGKLF